MKIENIKINGFGKLKNREIKFEDGINIIQGENEAGKSTILKFIISMLYGISKNKNGKNISDFEKYKPWENTDFSGKIKYSLDNNKVYEVYRDFKKKNPVIYNDLGEDVTDEFKRNNSKEINFFEQQVGVEKNLFLNTNAIEQQEIEIEKSDTNAIIQKISNLVSTGDDRISFKKALEKINKMQNERIGTERTKQRPINIVNDNINKLTKEKNNLTNYINEIENRETEKENINLKKEKLEKEKEELKAKKTISQNDEIKNIEVKFKRKICIFVIIFLLILALILGVVLRNLAITLIPLILSIVDIFVILKMNKKIKEQKLNLDTQKIDKEIENVDEKINNLKVRKHILETEKESMDQKLDELAKIEENLKEQEDEKEELTSLEISFNIAKECLESAYNEIKHNISPKFQKKLCEVASYITYGKYKNIVVNDEEGLQIETENGTYVPVNLLSIGTIDEMYLALRLSLLDEISDEKLTIILDESFAYFDDERLKNIIYYLQDKKYDYQIMILTCSNREINILNELKIEYHLNKL